MIETVGWTIAGLVIGGGGTALWIRRGMISEHSCTNCKAVFEEKFNSVATKFSSGEKQFSELKAMIHSTNKEQKKHGETLSAVARDVAVIAARINGEERGK